MIHKRQNQLRAVLFDMDGTLVDSEKLWSVSLDRTADDLGGVLSAHAREAMVGHDLVASIRMFLDDIGVEADPGETGRRLLAHTAELFADPMPWRDGAKDLLASVRSAGLSTALVTATHRDLVELALNTLGRDAFDAIVCGDEVSRNKPDPEPYVRAVEMLGVSIDEALAVEDSPNGSSSALAAGVAVLVVPSEVAVADVDGLTFAESLIDVDVAALQALHTHHHDSAAPLPSGLAVGPVIGIAR